MPGAVVCRACNPYRIELSDPLRSPFAFYALAHDVSSDRGPGFGLMPLPALNGRRPSPVSRPVHHQSLPSAPASRPPRDCSARDGDRDCGCSDDARDKRAPSAPDARAGDSWSRPCRRGTPWTHSSARSSTEMFSACAFCSALAIAERSNRSTRCAARLLVYPRIASASLTFKPRIRSTTSRAFCADPCPHCVQIAWVASIIRPLAPLDASTCRAPRTSQPCPRAP